VPAPRKDNGHQAEAGLTTPGSWIDQLQARLDRTSVGPWAVYGLTAGLLAGGLHLTHWLSGAMEFPALSVRLAWTGAYTPISLAGLHYLDRTAARSLARFQPALQAGQDDYRRALARLTSLPRPTVVLALVLGAAFMWTLLRLDRTFLGLLTGLDLPDSALLVAGWLNSSMILINLYCLVRQMSAVASVHGSAGEVNLYDWQPMFAFSNLTYQTAVIAVVLISCFVAVFPEVLQSPPGLLVAVLGLMLTGAAFFLPLAGLHTKLQFEKHRLLSDARRRTQSTLQELHQRIEAADLSSMQRMKDQLGSLLLEEDYLGRLRTWPWPPGLFLRVLGVIGLPILLFILQRAIQVWLGF
jgi:hypothetical protein